MFVILAVPVVVSPLVLSWFSVPFCTHRIIISRVLIIKKGKRNIPEARDADVSRAPGVIVAVSVVAGLREPPWCHRGFRSRSVRIVYL